MHDHKEKRYPPPAVYAKDGKPLLSWRVLILPYILHEEELFKEFVLSESWDSENNKKLLDKMPNVYSPIGIPLQELRSNCTYIQLFVGAGTCFDNKNGYIARQVMGWARTTVFAVEGSSLVPWTKPEDVLFEKDKPLPKLGGFFDAGFHILLGDGEVRFVKHKFNEDIMKRAILRKGPDNDDPVDLDDLDK
jgi:hypothetical protein